MYFESLYIHAHVHKAGGIALHIYADRAIVYTVSKI
jgi:hypothetical protein